MPKDIGMTFAQSVVLVVSSLLLGACSQWPTKVQPTLMVGGDRDAHGCIGSAGYSWCGQENACVRPWELARQKGLNFDGDHAYDQYCAGK